MSQPEDPARKGVSPEMIQAAQAIVEGGAGFPQQGADAEDYLSLASSNLVREIDQGGKVIPAMRDFDLATVKEINAVLGNFERLYTPGGWEMNNHITSLELQRDKLLRRVAEQRVAYKDDPSQINRTKMMWLETAAKKVSYAHGMSTFLAGIIGFTAGYYATEEVMKDIPQIKPNGESNDEAFHLDTLKVPDGRGGEVVLEGFGDLFLSPPDELRQISRETIVKWQSAVFTATFMEAAEVQREYGATEIDKTAASKPRERKEMHLEDYEHTLFIQIFAERYPPGHPQEGKIVTKRWHNNKDGKTYEVPELVDYFTSDPTLKNKRKYIALMTSMIELNALDRAEKAHNDATSIEIARGVRERAKAKLDRPTDKFADVQWLYSDLVARSIIALHLGTMSAAEIGWRWKLNKVDWALITEPWMQDMLKSAKVTETTPQGKRQEVVVTRTSDIASIYNIGDTPTAYYFINTIVGYGARGETSSTFPAGLSDKFRRLRQFQRPDQLVRVDDYLPWNEYVRNLVAAYRSGQWENYIARNDETFGKRDPRVVEYQNKYPSGLPTWVKINGQEFVIPLFGIPPVLYPMNLWRSMGENGGKLYNEPSLYERFLEKKPLHTVDFSIYNFQVMDWVSVNRAQGSRFLTLLFLNQEFSKDAAGAFGAFFDDPTKLSPIQDWMKRSRLWGRADDVESGLMGMHLLPPWLAKVTGERFNLFRAGNEKLNDSDRKIIVNQYKRGISLLVSNALDLPRTKGAEIGAITNFNGTLASLIDFYGEVYLGWFTRAGKMTWSGVSSVSNNLDARYHQDYKKIFNAK